MKLVDNARQFWRWWSMRLVFLGASPAMAWPLIPDDLKAALPEWFVSVYAVVAVVAIVAARVAKQDLPKGGK